MQNNENFEFKNKSEIKPVLLDAYNYFLKKLSSLQNSTWDHLRIEIWEDSGRIIFFPAKNGLEERVDQVCVQLHCEELKNDIYKLDSSDLSDIEFEHRIKNIVIGIAKTIDAAFKNIDSAVYKIYNQDGVQVDV